MARGPTRLLRPRDDALPDAVARDALPRGRECEGLPGRPYPQDRLGENLGDDLGKGERRAVEAAVPAAPRGGWPEAETISSMAAGPWNPCGGFLRNYLGTILERVVLGFQQDDKDSLPAAVQQVGSVAESAGARLLPRGDSEDDDPQDGSACLWHRLRAAIARQDAHGVHGNHEVLGGPTVHQLQQNGEG